MSIAHGVGKNAGFQIAFLGNHHQQRRVTGNVEGNAQRYVGAALVELQIQPSVHHVKLEKGMAGWELHAVDVRNVPGAHNDAAGIGVLLDGVDGLLDLINIRFGVRGAFAVRT